MSLLHEATDAKNFDVRLVEKNVTRGRVSPDAVEKHLNELPDDAENAEFVSIDSLMNDGTVQAAGDAHGQSSDSVHTHH
jgi:hypothetical protein